MSVKKIISCAAIFSFAAAGSQIAIASDRVGGDVGLTLQTGDPYGSFGLSLDYSIAPASQVEVGAGTSHNAKAFGAQYRHIFLPENWTAPSAEVGISRHTGDNTGTRQTWADAGIGVTSMFLGRLRFQAYLTYDKCFSGLSDTLQYGDDLSACDGHFGYNVGLGYQF